MYLLDTATLAEALRATPNRTFVRRLSYVPPADRWTSVITVSQLLEAARRAKHPKLMQNVIRLVASVRVAAFDLQAAQQFAKIRSSLADAGETDDVIIASIALANDFTLVTARVPAFRRYGNLRVESWTGG
jgi:tRNA(fMet)-specific endonuclease VapC